MSSRIEQIAIAVAPLLTGAWQYNLLASDKDGWNQRYSLSDDTQPGRVIFLTPEKNNRIKIYGRLPRYRYGSFGTDSITVSAERAPLAIAHDINRRFIPKLLEQWAIRAAEVERHEREAAEHVQRISLLRNVAPGLRGQYGHKIRADTSTFNFDYGRFTLYPGSGDCRPRLELNLSYDEVVQVLYFVKSLKTGN